jgi:hypothetical protein
MKRSYYLLGIVGTIAVVAGVFYFLHYRTAAPTPGTAGEAQNVGLPATPTQYNQPSTSQTPTPSLPGTGGVAPGIQRPKFGLVARNQVLDYFIDAQNNAILIQPDGQVVKITTGGPSTLSSSAIANLASAKFSYDGAKIMATFGGLSAPQGSIFDVAGKSWQPLSSGINSIGWSPNSYQIAYFNNKNNTKVLTIVDIANPKTKPVELLSIHAEDLNLDWPLQNKIILADKPSSLVPGSIWSYDTKQKILTQIAAGAPGLESIWAKGADFGLVFHAGAGGNGGSLSLRDTKGTPLNNLSLLTLPSKCAFDIETAASSSTNKSASSTNKTSTPSTSNQNATGTTPNYLYCAIPRDNARLKTSALPDDYEMKKFFTSDDFYRINLSDGTLAQVFADPSQNFDAADMKIFNNFLFFTNRYNQKLYWISLL